jgi:hypothetical protein
LVPDYRASDEVALALLAEVLTRIELANRWLERQPSIISTRGRPLPLLADIRSWETQAARFADRLGLGNQKRSRDASSGDALARYLAEREEDE